ncbi:hypothetical protein [Aquimarina intermedia]|uniref:GDSL-like lipase/acylhydrolase family protein n=1 Tax=Aquimarina intermedia TaxID=350814 RepID=A0A5S5C741_9FLAO|nr:hypothetical protein [Aquimarina intermedia]TYP75164.1 hypothetical protein BD809_103228 [Aquimarina intermedia]
MKKLFLNLIIYGFLILIMLELLVRVFHLGKDTPTRYVDQYNVEKWMPNQNGFAVTGNRRQNFSEYNINQSGYNSYREFNPTYDKKEIALVGDSFIEGFHQNYYNSIGKKIENLLEDVEVYEYGYAGYDMADQLHLVHAYKDQFDKIDHVIFGIKFSNDLTRGEYSILSERLALESPLNKALKKSKLLVYAKSIGLLDPPKLFIAKLKNTIFNSQNRKGSKKSPSNKTNTEQEYLNNFKQLVATYGYDKQRFVLLLNSKETSNIFLKYLDQNGFKYIDFYKRFQASPRPKNLIYDRHWNNYGRTLIAKEIVSHLRTY